MENSAIVMAASSAVLAGEADNQLVTVEKYVREYFKATPILAEIAHCESRFRHFNKNGDVMRGRITPADVGVMQINEHYHLVTSQKLGFDIHTLDGNLSYAKYLYDKQGTQPWSASSPCWNS